MKTRFLALVLAPLAVLAGVALGGAAHAAPAPTVTTTVTTHFAYSTGSPVLTVPSSNVVPADGTAVSFDLQAALDHGQTPAALAR